MAQLDFSRISVALWGGGEIAGAFVEKLRQRHPGVRIFDREAELRNKTSEDNVLVHLEVADMDAVFKRQGTAERAVIQCHSRHQMFHYDLDVILRDRTARQILLQRMLDCVARLLLPPEPVHEPPMTDGDGDEADIDEAAGEEVEEKAQTETAGG